MALVPSGAAAAASAGLASRSSRTRCTSFAFKAANNSAASSMATPLRKRQTRPATISNIPAAATPRGRFATRFTSLEGPLDHLLELGLAHVAHLDLPCVLLRQFLDRGRDGPARSAPRRPEVDQHGYLRAEHLGLEVLVGDGHQVRARHVDSWVPGTRVRLRAPGRGGCTSRRFGATAVLQPGGRAGPARPAPLNPFARGGRR